MTAPRTIGDYTAFQRRMYLLGVPREHWTDLWEKERQHSGE